MRASKNVLVVELYYGLGRLTDKTSPSVLPDEQAAFGDLIEQPCYSILYCGQFFTQNIRI